VGGKGDGHRDQIFLREKNIGRNMWLKSLPYYYNLTSCSKCSTFLVSLATGMIRLISPLTLEIF
jgi:hypothetical protein